MIWKADKDGVFSLWDEEQIMFTGYAAACSKDGRKIDTRDAELKSREDTDTGMILTFRAENGLMLKEILSELEGMPSAQCVLSDLLHSEVESNHLEPLILKGNRACAVPVIDELTSKMLLVPYDNDLWNRYEIAPIAMGRTSYDLTVFLDEETREGFLIGAADFDTWKNGFVCAHTVRPEIHCVSGIADLGSRDVCEHGSLIGESVSSSRLVFAYGPDYRLLLEQYGALISKLRKPLRWQDGVPFGFNTFAGLSGKLDLRIFEKTAHFLQEELAPRGFCGEKGYVFTNFDFNWEPFDFEERMRIRDEIHTAGHRTGIYDGPHVHNAWVDVNDEIPEVPGVTYKDILLRDEKGEVLPAISGLMALDVTHPAWYEMTRKKFERFIAQGYDYIKIDFLSQGAMEGNRYDKSVRTGRQAITKAYSFIADLCANAGRPFFISYSLAPLFPCGLAHSRRYSCDTFGTADCVEYALNAQTYAWWVNGNLYEFNDPDHLTLYHSINRERITTEGEARARYTTGVISGGLMLLSDDYDIPEACERAFKFAGNGEINALARSHRAFRPAEFNASSASHAYSAEIDGGIYLAVFSWKNSGELIAVDTDRAGVPEGTYRDMWTGRRFSSEKGRIFWETDSCDALLLKLEEH